MKERGNKQKVELSNIHAQLDEKKKHDKISKYPARKNVCAETSRTISSS